MKGVRLYAFVGFLLMASQVQAQTDRFLDKTVLQNGTVIWGITELEEGQVKIFLTENDSVLIPDFMVKSIKTGKFNPSLYAERVEGFYYELSTGFLIGKAHHSADNEGTLSLSAAGGYKFNRLLGVGLGAGVDFYLDQRHIPLFIDIQGDWLDSRLTPFHQLNLGWSYAADRTGSDQVERVKGGAYLRPSLGVRWHFPRHSWHLKVSYVLQQATRYFEPIDLWDGGNMQTTEERTMQRLAVAVGISF